MPVLWYGLEARGVPSQHAATLSSPHLLPAPLTKPALLIISREPNRVTGDRMTFQSLA